jgi:Gelsolin repeat
LQTVAGRRTASQCLLPHAATATAATAATAAAATFVAAADTTSAAAAAAPASLNTGDVFILDAGLALYLYNGEGASRAEKLKGVETIARIKVRGLRHA